MTVSVDKSFQKRDITYKDDVHPWDEKGTPTCLGIPLVRIRRIRRITDKRYPITPTGVLRELFCVTSLKKGLMPSKWRRGDSNPRPEMLQDRLLHA